MIVRVANDARARVTFRGVADDLRRLRHVQTHHEHRPRQTISDRRAL